MIAPKGRAGKTELSLRDLRPDLFGDGERLCRVDMLRAPTETTPQMGLHWIAVSSVCSLNPDFALKFSSTCIELGADLLLKDVLTDIKKSGASISANTLESKVIKINPLCSAILNRNTQAQVLFSGLLSEACSKGRIDPDTVGVHLQWRGKNYPLSAWSFCAHLHEKLPFELLQTGFRVDPESPQHVLRLSLALEHLLLSIAEPCDTERLFNKSSGTIGGLLVMGAVPDPARVRDLGVDPTSLLSLLCADRSIASLKSLRQLIDAKYPLDPLPKTHQKPLHVAASSNNGAALMALLNAGANPRIQDGRGLTLEEALHQDGRSEMIDMLRTWTARKFALDAMGLLDLFLIKPTRRLGGRFVASFRF